MTKLLILDKDGTLVRPVSGAKFVQSPEDQGLLPGVAEALARYRADGWVMAIASNQGGVAAGYKTLDSAIAEMRYCLRLLPQIYNAYFCPDLEGQKCWHVEKGFAQSLDHKYRNGLGEPYKGLYRKPNHGMISHIQMIETFPNPKETLFVGDRPEDECAAEAAGVRFMWADDWRAYTMS